MHRLSFLVLIAACSGSSADTDTADTADTLDTGLVASHVQSTATGDFSTGDYAIRIDVSTVTDATGEWVESIEIGATDMAAYNDMTLEVVDVYLDDTRVDVPAPVVGWEYQGAPGVEVPSHIHGRATVWNGDYVEFDYDMALFARHAIDAPIAGATLPFGDDVAVQWSPSGGNVSWRLGMNEQQARTDYVSDDTGSGTFPADLLTVAGEDTLWVARFSGEVLPAPRSYLGHGHEARVRVVVGP